MTLTHNRWKVCDHLGPGIVYEVDRTLRLTNIQGWPLVETRNASKTICMRCHKAVSGVGYYEDSKKQDSSM